MTEKEFDKKWKGADTDKLSDEQLQQFKQDRFAMYEQAGFLDTFDSPYDEQGEHNGMTFKVVRRATTEECDLEAMPLWLVEFENGDTAYCYPEEICKAEKKAREDSRKTNKNTIAEVRCQAVQTIKDLMNKHGLDTVYASDIDKGSSLIVLEDTYDGNNSYTLDYIQLQPDGTLQFQSSSCSAERTDDEDSLPTDVLAGLADWLEANEDALGEEDTEEETKNENRPARSTVTLEDILQRYFRCSKPFLKNPRKTHDGEYTEYFTRRGGKAYEQLVALIEDLSALGVLRNRAEIIIQLDTIVRKVS